MQMLSKSTNQEEVFTHSSSSSSSENSGFVSFCKKLTRKRSKGEEEQATAIATSSSSDEDGGGCYERVFAYFDEDGDGRVSAAELQRAVRAVGGELTAEEAAEAVRLSDSDGDGMLGIEDFTKMMDGRGVEEEMKEDELREAFGMYAMKGTEYITPKSLKRMLARLGESTTTENCKAMIRRFDLNGDGVLAFDEFKIMMS